MAKYIILLFVFFTFQKEKDYEKIFGENYKNAVNFIVSQKKEIERVCEMYEIDKSLFTAIFFPEVIRYSLLSDYFETAFLESVYINFGKKYADFSIGRMQMKPSFVEKIEAYLQNNPHAFAPREFEVFYNFTSVKGIINRKIRIERLKTFAWQLHYLACFVKIVNHKFNNFLKDKSLEEQVVFISTAYNHGFDCSYEEVMRWTESKIFPYGHSVSNKQYAYSQVSVFFYKQSFKLLFSN